MKKLYLTQGGGMLCNRNMINNEEWNLGAIRPTYKQKMNYQQVGF